MREYWKNDNGGYDYQSSRHIFLTDVGQKRVPLPYSSNRRLVNTRTWVNQGSTGEISAWHIDTVLSQIYIRMADPSISDAALYSKAYSRFVGMVHDNAMMLVNLAEGRQTVALISQLLHNIRRPIRTIGEKMQREARKASKMTDLLKVPLRDIPDVHLAVVFGILPLAHDVHTAAVTLTREWPKISVRKGAKEVIPMSTKWTQGWGGGGFSNVRKKWVMLSATVKVDNPNVAIANSLGLLNPAAVAWELVPFSFVLDWWWNIGVVLGGLTDLFGFTLENPYCSRGQTDIGHMYHYVNAYGQHEQEDITYSAVNWTRTLGIEPPKLAYVGGDWKLGRLAIATSLLLQQVKRTGLLVNDRYRPSSQPFKTAQ